MKYMDIKTDRLYWTTADYDMERFFKKLGCKVKATIYNGYAYVFVYDNKKPSKSLIFKNKM